MCITLFSQKNTITEIKRYHRHRYVTLHHKMSRNVPGDHFHVLYFLKVNSMLYTMVKNIFKSEDLWPSYMFLNMVVRHSALLGKLALNVEDFYVKTIGCG